MKIHTLTSLRFIFALMVFATHLRFLRNSSNNFWSGVFEKVLQEGYLGVSFFFILSGFVLSYKYQQTFLGNNQSTRAFYLARFARIYPLHLLCFLIALPTTVALLLHAPTKWVFAALANLTLIQSMVPMRDVMFSFNGVSWSISVEMVCYAFFPWLVFWISKIGKHKFRNIWLAIIISCVPVGMFYVNEDWQHSLFYVSPIARTFDFILGMLLFSGFTYYKTWQNNYSSTFLEVASIALFTVFFALHPYVPQVFRYSVYYWFPMSTIILIFAQQAGIISRWLSTKWLVYLGEISFGFYMFHLLVIRYFHVFNNRYWHLQDEGLIIFLIFSIALLMSHISYRYFEAPIRNYIRVRWAIKKAS